MCSNLFRYYMKPIDSMFPCVCSVIDHRRRQNMVRTSVTRSATPGVSRFCSYHILTSSVIYYRADARFLSFAFFQSFYTLDMHLCHPLLQGDVNASPTSPPDKHLIVLCTCSSIANHSLSTFKCLVVCFFLVGDSSFSFIIQS